MDNSVLLYSCILLLGVFLSSVSQVLLKKAAIKNHSSVIKEYVNPFVIIAYMMFVVTTFMCIIAYKVVPLSMGPILEATSYIYVTIFGVTIFKEKIGLLKLFALFLIIIGIFVFSFFG